MADDGNQIRLDATKGKEKIQLKDQAKNEIVLDAANERIALIAPKHKTKVQLGNTEKAVDVGIYLKSDAKYYLDVKDKYIKNIEKDSITTIKANYETNVEGSYETSVRGDYGTLVRGDYTLDVAHRYKARIQGLKTETLIGGKASAILGKKAEVVVGVKAESCLGLKCVVELAGKVGVSITNTDWFRDNQKDKVKGKLQAIATTICHMADSVNTVAKDKVCVDAQVINLCSGNLTCKQ